MMGQADLLPPGRGVVMLCTAARGGMRAVVEGYRRDGLFERWRVRWLVTHVEGGAMRRLAVAAGAFLRLTGWLWRGQVALLHSHMAMRGSFWRKALFNAWARLHGVPVIAHLHGSELRQWHAAQPAWRRALIRRELEACATVLVLSSSWAEFVRAIAPRARVVELPNCTPLPPPPPERPASADRVQVLFLGLVGLRKGVYELLPAFAQASRAQPALRLCVAGNGEVERALALAAELGVADRVDLPGWIDGEAKLRLLREADIYVLPSHNENLPVSIIEAMGHALPVIGTRVGGVPEMLRDGVDGILVAPGDTHALEAAMLCLAGDVALRRAMGAAARERASTCYSPEVVMLRLEAVYVDVLPTVGPGGSGRGPASEPCDAG